MNVKNYTEGLEIPEGVKVSLNSYTFTVSGPKGEVKKELASKKIKFSVEANKIIFNVAKYSKKEKRLVNSFVAHLKNMFRGARVGYVYKLKVCPGHFPMTLGYSNSELTVKNFVGEKIPRVLKIKKGVDVKIEGDVVIVSGADRELTGQTAGAIEQLTRRCGFDRRVFQQGIYIFEKPAREI